VAGFWHIDANRPSGRVSQQILEQVVRLRLKKLKASFGLTKRVYWHQISSLYFAGKQLI